MLGRTLWAALVASVTHGRAALAVLAIIGLPMALPFVLVQWVGHLMLSGGTGDPVALQHLIWITGSPEVVSGFFAVWLLFFAPWAIGIWGLRARPSLLIGWEIYVRYLVIVLWAGAVVVLGRILTALPPVPLPARLVVDVIANALALYVLLRFAPTFATVRDGGVLRLWDAWRSTRPETIKLLLLSGVWTLLGICLQVVAEILSISASFAFGAMDLGPSRTLYLIIIGAPGFITGVAAAVVGLVTIALVWTVAEKSRP